MRACVCCVSLYEYICVCGCVCLLPASPCCFCFYKYIVYYKGENKTVLRLVGMVWGTQSSNRHVKKGIRDVRSSCAIMMRQWTEGMA